MNDRRHELEAQVRENTRLNRERLEQRERIAELEAKLRQAGVEP